MDGFTIVILVALGLILAVLHEILKAIRKKPD